MGAYNAPETRCHEASEPSSKGTQRGGTEAMLLKAGRRRRAARFELCAIARDEVPPRECERRRPPRGK